MTRRPPIIWLEPDLPAPSGGARYNALAQEQLRAGGHALTRLAVPGGWPQPEPADVDSTLQRLRTARAGQPGAIVVVDGLIGGCVPQLFDGAQDPPAEVLLVHLPLAAEPGAPARLDEAERRAVRAARAVVATSHWAAADLTRRHGREGVVVAEPGVSRGGLTRPAWTHGPTAGPPDDRPDGSGSGPADSRPPVLAVVGSLTPRKNHALLATALAPLLDRPWELIVAGPGAESGHGAKVLQELRTALHGRVRAVGALPPEEVADLLAGTDLLLLPSLAETYGMVVTEAAVHDVPSLVVAGTGAEEAQAGAGLALTADPRDWTAALRDWLARPDLRARLRDRARERGARVPTWQSTAETLSTLAASLRTG